MNLDELEPHERLAFVGLVRTLTRQDGELSHPEIAAVSELARAVGSAEFWGLMSEAQEKLPTPADVSRAAQSVTRPEVRAWIHATLVALAESDGVDVAEAQLLAWLGRAWNVA